MQSVDEGFGAASVSDLSQAPDYFNAPRKISVSEGLDKGEDGRRPDFDERFGDSRVIFETLRCEKLKKRFDGPWIS